MGEALYRKYRSKSLDEIVGQEHVTTTIKNALKSGKISHAYLLTGPRGTGKTSIARIIAHEVNKLPYSDQTHLDIIEIDAASNRRIDEVRDIREKVRIAPTSATYKVYIIDEVHMLTKEAFNALLKTLEEPPKHAIFILATTEVHKLPETIISRTQRFNLKPIDSTVMLEHLKHLAKQESIDIDDASLKLIVQHSNGGLRDAIGMLDQLSSHGKHVEVQNVESMLGVAPSDAIAQLARTIRSGNPKQLSELLGNLEDQGVQAPQIAHQLSALLKQQLLDGHGDRDNLELMQQLLLVPGATEPQKLLELLLLDYLLKSAPSVPLPPEPILDVTPAPQEPPEDSQPAVEPRPEKTEEKTRPQATSTENLDQLIEKNNWLEVLQAVKKRHNTLYGIVRMASPRIEDGELVLCFDFPFHEKRMNEAKNRQLIQEVIADVTGQEVSVICVTNAKKAPVQREEPVQATNNSDTLGTITDIFGGGEVLEN